MNRGNVRWSVCLTSWIALLVWSAEKAQPSVDNQICLECHEDRNPRIVSTWKESPMGRQGVSCIDCHGSDHQSNLDAYRTSMAVGRVCQECHPREFDQFQSGKHARAWESVYTLPAVETLPKELIEGEQGCGGCHSIGRTDGGCDSCHTRHTFSKEEARHPNACLPCHGGVNHPQWEIWRTSKHGVVQEVSRKGRGPTCQICHMAKGNHGVRTAWSLLALRSTERNPEWAASRKTILRWLGFIDTMDESEIKGVVLPAYEEWAQQRNQMIEVCGECHSRLFVREKMREIDAIIMKADRIMADAIEIVRALYREGLLPKPKENPPSFPDLLGFYKAPNPLEEKLSTMFLKYRLIMLHGAFHNNPDFTANDGWVKLRKGFDEIQRMALELRNAGE